jgi:hypothetical protein
MNDAPRLSLSFGKKCPAAFQERDREKKRASGNKDVYGFWMILSRLPKGFSDP